MGWLRLRFLLATGLLLVLTLAATAYVVREINTLSRQRAELQLLDTTRALSQVVEGQLRQFETMLNALVGDEALQREDFSAFDRRARALLAGPDAWIVIGDRTGKQRVNTRLPAGAPLPTGYPPTQAFRVLDTGATHICDLSRGMVTKRILCVDVPVMQGGRAAYHLSVIFKPSLLQKLLSAQRIPSSRYATIIDSKGTVVWRSVSAERFVGKSATADMRAALARSSEGVKDSVSLEGTPTVAAFSRARSGYSFIVAVPRGQLAAGGPALQSGWVVAALLILLALAIALYLGNRLSGAITSLASAAGRFATADHGRFRPTGIPEVDAVGAALERAAEARDRTEERLRDITDALPVLISYVDADECFQFVNKAYAQWFARPLDQIAGKRIAEVMTPDMYAQRLPWIKRALAGEAVRYEVIFPHPEGARHTSVEHLPHRSATGEVLGMYALVQDISPQKRVEAELRASRDRFAAVLDAAPAAILIATDPSCHEIEGNASAHELMGTARGSNLSRSEDGDGGAPPFRVFDLEDRELQPSELPVQRAARGEELWMYEERLQFPDGRFIHLLGNAVPLRSPSGAVTGAVGAFIDISERKRAEEHQQLLVGELNHRVKNTLAIVQSLAQQSFKDGKSTEDSRAAFEARLVALSAAHSLLTRQSWEQADLAQVVQTSVLAATGRKAGQVAIDGPALNLMPQTAVSVAMAVHELCTNAVKYGALSIENGRVAVQWTLDGLGDGRRLRFSWQESGGPPVVMPTVRGFGSRMIERGLAGELRGEAQLRFDPSGLRFILDAPMPDAETGSA